MLSKVTEGKRTVEKENLFVKFSGQKNFFLLQIVKMKEKKISSLNFQVKKHL